MGTLLQASNLMRVAREVGGFKFLGNEIMAGEAEDLLDGLGDVLPVGEPEGGVVASPPSLDEDKPGPSMSRSLSIASAHDGSFRSSIASASDVSWRSFDALSADTDDMPGGDFWTFLHVGEIKFQGNEIMEGEADDLLDGLADVLPASSPSQDEDEPGPSMSRSLSFASARDGSFRSSTASASDVSWRSSDALSADTDEMYRRVQSEYEEIPSFRWIPSPLRWWGSRKGTAARTENGAAAAAAATGKKNRGKMVHLDGHQAFTYEYLMRVSTVALGKRAYGSVHKATLTDGSQLTVRRLTEVQVACDFEAQVKELGKIRHPNLLALRAYYFSPDGEKLLVFDDMPAGDLWTFLHARDPHTHVGWSKRMDVAVRITRGLHHLHTTGNMVHGNLTCENVLLGSHARPKIADYGLFRLIAMDASSNRMPTVHNWAMLYRPYCAPELSDLTQPNTKTDVYSLGVIILELLTGKSPFVMAVNGVDLPRWVAMIAKERGTFEVFDRELRETRADELLYALNVGLHCMDPSPDQRPEVVQVLHLLSEIRAYVGIEKKSHVDHLVLRGTELSKETRHVDFEK